MEIWKISIDQGRQRTRHLVFGVWHFRCPTPKYGCGVLFIWSKAFQSLHSDKLIGLTLSCFILTAHLRLMGKQNLIIMKKVLNFVALLLAFVCVTETAMAAKTKKIVTNPETAKIYVDGNYVADGSYLLTFKGKNDVFSLKVSAPGYVDKRIKVYKDDARSSIQVNLVQDDALEGSVASNLANRFFTVSVREGLDSAQAWKLMSQVMLNYFDEFRTADQASGYMNTTWVTQTFPRADVKVRTMVQVKESSLDGLAYSIRISTEIAPLKSGENSYQPWNRVLKKYETLISEMQQRLGKK